MLINKYLGGNNFNKAVTVANKIINQRKIPVINYAIEHSGSGMDTFNEYKQLNYIINNDYRIALKLSSFNFDKILIHDIVDMYKEKNIKILIDAEDNNFNNRYHDMTNELIQKYNYDDPTIIKTYQMYRKDSLQTLNEDLYAFGDLHMGVKLVRGAYWNNESCDGHLFTNKKDTDISYNSGVMKLFYNNSKSLNVLATHNTESINLGVLLNKENKKFEFGHLHGMKERAYKDLKEEIVNVYIPYGPYFKMIPYLIRRLYENIDTIKYM
jgi:proline dehydrogenase|uniref:Proline dehydrogenase domain-containing protein n=1 Tax=viral metagenome TaxID=1070528 RepID=A0A6C0LKR3_9ZZZZ